MKSFKEIIREYKLNENLETGDFEPIIQKLKSLGFEVSLSKSTLGGTTHFLKVFGPKETWKNGIALNSPFHVMIRIDNGEMDMPTVSYQVRNAKAKMRKSKYKDAADLEKKLMDYFKKNKPQIDSILSESYGFEYSYSNDIYDNLEEETVYVQKRMKSLGGNQYANDVTFAKKISNAVTKVGLTAKLEGDRIAITGDTDKIEALKKSLKGVTFMKESKGSDYTIYHKTFSSAVQHALSHVEKLGYEVEGEEWDRKVALGPKKPSSGKTNSYTIDLMKNGKESKRKLQMQVYYDEGRYELNMYVS